MGVKQALLEIAMEERAAWSVRAEVRYADGYEERTLVSSPATPGEWHCTFEEAKARVRDHLEKQLARPLVRSVTVLAVAFAEGHLKTIMETRNR